MLRARKATHIRADFGDEGLRNIPANPRNGVKTHDHILELTQSIGNLRTHLRNGRIQPIDLDEVPPNQEPLMGTNMAHQGLL